jgi:hypothetical protein
MRKDTPCAHRKASELGFVRPSFPLSLSPPSFHQAHLILSHLSLQWSFAQSNQVLLPDEYDPIHVSLLPFCALPPFDFLSRTAEAERVPETYTLIVKAAGKVVLYWNDDYARNEYWAARPRADAQINLLEPFLERLGEMRITFSIHDEPSIVLPYERRAELEGIAKGPVGARECWPRLSFLVEFVLEQDCG